jgi:hypothetical protein
MKNARTQKENGSRHPKTKIAFKAIAILIMVIFVSGQVAWAGRSTGDSYDADWGNWAAGAALQTAMPLVTNAVDVNWGDSSLANPSSWNAPSVSFSLTDAGTMNAINSTMNNVVGSHIVYNTNRAVTYAGYTAGIKPKAINIISGAASYAAFAGAGGMNGSLPESISNNLGSRMLVGAAAGATKAAVSQSLYHVSKDGEHTRGNPYLADLVGFTAGMGAAGAMTGALGGYSSLSAGPVGLAGGAMKAYADNWKSLASHAVYYGIMAAGSNNDKNINTTRFVAGMASDLTGNLLSDNLEAGSLGVNMAKSAITHGVRAGLTEITDGKVGDAVVALAATSVANSIANNLLISNELANTPKQQDVGKAIDSGAYVMQPGSFIQYDENGNVSETSNFKVTSVGGNILSATTEAAYGGFEPARPGSGLYGGLAAADKAYSYSRAFMGAGTYGAGLWKTGMYVAAVDQSGTNIASPVIMVLGLNGGAVAERPYQSDISSSSAKNQNIQQGGKVTVK